VQDAESGSATCDTISTTMTKRATKLEVMATSYGEFEPVIGLEVHAQLLTRTKLFCACETSFGDPPNTHTCPVCLGLPGSLPVPNAEAVRLATLAGLALGCKIQPRSVWARKNYFYPDLPKGYQITQYEEPYARHGRLVFPLDGVERSPRILRIHMEEDAGKTLHHGGGASIVDLNRAGTPLIEIVGEPDLRSPAEAAVYLKRLREILMTIGANDGNLEQGSFRCDANVSVRRTGDARLGVRTELKNINSFRFVEEAIDVEIRRQIREIELGRELKQATRGYNSERRETYLLREKEGDAGYRYFPDPDLQVLDLDDVFVAQAREALPELPDAKRHRYVELGLSVEAAQVLTGHPRLSGFFDECLVWAGSSKVSVEPVKIANFIQAEVLRDAVYAGLSATFSVQPRQVTELLALVQEGAISGKQAKSILAEIAGTERAPAEVVKASGMAVINDEAAIVSMARELLAANPKQVAQYKAGKVTMLGFFVGQIMKATKGSANPTLTDGILKKLLAEAP
jgi:aspartyl-tRNA(Asn)/glutamyl-tRNA(Gln) amidotransferase subunit B